MSKLIVEVCRVTNIDPHPNGDRLVICTVKGWKCCISCDPETKKAAVDIGDLCVYIPPDAVLKKELIERLGVRNYVNQLSKNSSYEEGSGRVKAARIRGIPSYGIIMPIKPELGDDPNWKEGDNVIDFFNIVKWEPPPECLDGDAESPSSKFFEYTSIEHYGNYASAFEENEEVVITEKIHGQNLRMGMILENDDNGNATWALCAGSHSVRRKEFDANGKKSKFWLAFNQNTIDLLNHIKDMPFDEDKFSILLYGELFGSGIQDLSYGLTNGAIDCQFFDISINNRYLDYNVKSELFKQFGIKQVPILYHGPFQRDKIEEWTSGPTTLSDKITTKFKGREGVVITPAKEEFYNRIINGRKILKSISSDYLDRSKGTDFH